VVYFHRLSFHKISLHLLLHIGLTNSGDTSSSIMTGIRLSILKWAILHCNKLWTQWLRAVITEAYSTVESWQSYCVARTVMQNPTAAVPQTC
jgi:hypothetical protein